jgi:hypothetical protein
MDHSTDGIHPSTAHLPLGTSTSQSMLIIIIIIIIIIITIIIMIAITVSIIAGNIYVCPDDHV